MRGGGSILGRDCGHWGNGTRRLPGAENGEGKDAGRPYAVLGVADVEGCGRAVAPA